MCSLKYTSYFSSVHIYKHKHKHIREPPSSSPQPSNVGYPLYLFLRGVRNQYKILIGIVDYIPLTVC
jgi:hypothetical protein